MGTCSTSKQTTTANSLEIPGRSIRITFNEKSLKYQLCWDQLFRSITVLLLDLLLWERKLLNQNNSESRRTLAPLLLDYARSDKGHSFPQNFAHVSFGGRFEYSEGIGERGGERFLPGHFGLHKRNPKRHPSSFKSQWRARSGRRRRRKEQTTRFHGASLPGWAGFRHISARLGEFV